MKKTFTILFSIMAIGFLITINNASGQSQVEWEKRYGGSSSDEAYEIQETSDGGYVLVGNTKSSDGDVGVNNGGQDIWIGKLDINGNLEWKRSFGGSDLDSASDVIQTNDGGYIIAASSKSTDFDVGGNKGATDSWVLKLDRNGNLEWENNYGGSGDDTGTSIIQLADGTYILAGTADDNDGDVRGTNGNRDIWILKLDALGNIIWHKSYGGDQLDLVAVIRQTSDGGFIVGGDSFSNNFDVGGNNGIRDFWILKLNSAGDLIWENNYGGPESEQITSIQQTRDGGYVFAGFVSTSSNKSDYSLVKVDSNGNVQWTRTYGGTDHDIATSIYQTNDNGFVVGGYTKSDDGDVEGNTGGTSSWTLKLNSIGNIEWQVIDGGTNGDTCRELKATRDGGYVIAGSSGLDFWILKYAPLSVSIEEMNIDPQFSISPNPSQGRILIDSKDITGPVGVQVFDIMGQCIYKKDNVSIPITLENISPGHYFILLNSENRSYSQEFISY